MALSARLRVRAEVDPLTGLGNRRRLESALAKLHPGDIVIAIDLDNFKAVNDTLGHDVGDDVLRLFGKHLASSTRSGELAIRTGGEEFILILAGRDANHQAAAALLSRLASEWWDRSPLTTFSAGAVVHPGGPAASTVKRADQALYEAKRRGRAAGWVLAEDRRGANLPPVGRLIAFPGEPFPRRPKAADIVLPPPLANAAVPGPRQVRGTTQVTPPTFR